MGVAAGDRTRFVEEEGEVENLSLEGSGSGLGNLRLMGDDSDDAVDRSEFNKSKGSKSSAEVSSWKVRESGDEEESDLFRK